MDDTPAEPRRGSTRPGRHRRGRGRHAAPRRRAPSATTIAKAALVLAAAGLIAGVTSLGFPRATSNASVRHDDSPDATTVTTSTASTTSTTVATPTTDRSVAPVSGASRLCPIDWRQSAWHVKRLIRCAADHYDVSQRKALYVAWRESRYLPYAYNGAGPAAGVFQHLLRYWPDRADTYGFPDRSPFNARANILVTMRMVRDLGWSPWAL